jgi:hypothetical protein
LNRWRAWSGRFELFDALSLGLIVFLIALALSYWHKFPVHMDSFYHMGVTAGYARAGGIALHSFWEYAPAGRAQLYPPLLHVTMFALDKIGLSMVSVGRLVSFAAFPLILLSGWYGMRALFSSRTALYSTVVLSSCYLLFWHSAVESAASLVLILTPLVFVAIDRDRKVAAALLLALALYSHLTLCHLVALGLFIYAVHRRELFKRILMVLGGAYLLWLPWGIHILVNRASLSIDSAGTSGGVTVHVLIWTVALAGFVYCYFKKGKYYLLPSFLLGFIPIIFFYPDRFWNAHGFVPLAMLGGVALSALHGLLGEKMPKLIGGRRARSAVIAAVMAVPVVVLLLVDPVYAAAGSRGGPAGGQPPGQSPGAQQALQLGQQPPAPVGGQPLPPPGQGPPNGSLGQAGQAAARGQAVQAAQAAPPGPGGLGGSSGFHSNTTTVLSLLGHGNAIGQQSLDSQVLIGPDTIELADLVKANTTEDQIVFCADGSLGNLITGLTGRASTGGMFHEVRSDGQGDNSVPGQGGDAAAAYLLVVPGRQAQGNAQSPSSSPGPAVPGQPSGIDARQIGPGAGVTGPPLGAGPGAAGSQLSSALDLSKYQLVGTVGQYSVYKNTAATATVGGHGTVIPWAVVFLLLGIALAMIAIDWFRPTPLWSRKHRSTGNDGEPHAPRNTGFNGFMKSERGTGGNGVLAIVPCYNEAENVKRVISELESTVPFADILVVDDGSKDRTAAVARAAGAAVISHAGNTGIGAAVRTGMMYAVERGYDVAVQVDGDGQHDPGYVQCLLGTLEAGLADVVIGSRFLGIRGYRPPLVRRIGTVILSGAVTLVTGRKATDTTSGFRAMNKRALAFLVENYRDDFPESESLVLMHRAGIRWMEIPVSMRSRVNGSSSIRGITSAYFMVKVLSRITLDAFRSGVPERERAAYASRV